MSNPLMTKAHNAAGPIAKHSVVKFHTDEESVVVATAVADKSFGVTDNVDVVSGESVDVHTHGIVDVVYGDVVTAGDRLTANASGQAVAVSGASDEVVGVAMVSGVAGDIGKVKI